MTPPHNTTHADFRSLAALTSRPPRSATIFRTRLSPHRERSAALRACPQDHQLNSVQAIVRGIGFRNAACRFDRRPLAVEPVLVLGEREPRRLHPLVPSIGGAVGGCCLGKLRAIRGVRAKDVGGCAWRLGLVRSFWDPVSFWILRKLTAAPALTSGTGAAGAPTSEGAGRCRIVVHRHHPSALTCASSPAHCCRYRCRQHTSRVGSATKRVAEPI